MDSSHSTQASHSVDSAESAQPARSYPSPVIPVSGALRIAWIVRIARSSPAGSVSCIVSIPLSGRVGWSGGVTRAAGVMPDTTDTTDMQVARDLRVSPVVSVVPVLRVSPVIPDYAVLAVIPFLVAVRIRPARSDLLIVRSVTVPSFNRIRADSGVKRTVTVVSVSLLGTIVTDRSDITVTPVVQRVTNRMRVPVSTALSAMSNSADLGIVAPTTFLPNPRTVADFSVSSIVTVVSEKLFSTTARTLSLLPYVRIVPFMMIVPYLPNLPNLMEKPCTSVQSILTILLIPTTE